MDGSPLLLTAIELSREDGAQCTARYVPHSHPKKVPSQQHARNRESRERNACKYCAEYKCANHSPHPTCPAEGRGTPLAESKSDPTSAVHGSYFPRNFQPSRAPPTCLTTIQIQPTFRPKRAKQTATKLFDYHRASSQQHGNVIDHMMHTIVVVEERGGAIASSWRSPMHGLV